MKLTVNLPRIQSTLIKNVRCNGKNYPISFPHSAPSFIEIIQSMEVGKEHERMLAILSKQSNELESIQQFYVVEEACLHYFNTKIELNTSDFVVTIVSEPDKALKQLDKLKFADFLSVVKQGYDTLSVKLHAKLSRRLKKYLSDSNRSEVQQKQIRQLINLIKENSSEEDEVEVKTQPVFLKSIEKVDSITLPAPVPPQKKKPSNPFKKDKEKGYESEQEKSSPQVSSNRDQQSQMSEPVQIVESAKIKQPKQEKSQTKGKHVGHKHHKKIEQNGEDEWQDVKEQKENKRRAKNLMKKHLKNDRQKSQELPDDANDQERSQPVVKQCKPRRDKNKNDGGQTKKLFGNFKEKPQKDVRVLLGINGDTDDGWRQRYRVSIIPQFDNRVSNKAQKNGKDTNGQSQSSDRSAKPVLMKQQSKQLKVVVEQKQQIKTQNMDLKKSEVIKIEAKQKSLTKLYTFPTDGKTFTLNTNQSYNLLVNKLFWVKLQPDKVIIQKVGADASGFIRNCKFKSSEDFLLQAEDLTLSFVGMSNLEDGGIKFGNPVIKDFTENDSQWFKVRDLQVFGYV